jgi:hypothetical protein
MWLGRRLFFNLLFPDNSPLHPPPHRCAPKRAIRSVIWFVVQHFHGHELDIQLSDIFLETFNPTLRRNEDNKTLPALKVLTEFLIPGPNCAKFASAKSNESNSVLQEF